MKRKNNEPDMDRDRPIDQIRRVTWVGLGVNLFLACVKFTGGHLGASQAVIADAVHSLSDMSTDLAVILGVKYWSAPPDEGHPYGHRRIETMITAAIGISLAVVAISIGYRALSTIREVHLSQPGWTALVGALSSILFKEGLYRWTLAVGKRTKSPSVVANAWHHRTDAFSSIPVILAVAAAMMSPELAFLDHVGALVVAIFILKVSWDITYPAIGELSDSGASQKDLEKVESIASGVAGVEYVESIRTRHFGSGLYVDLNIQVEGKMSVRSGHDISGAVKQALLENGPDVLDVVVHIEPCEETRQ